MGLYLEQLEYQRKAIDAVIRAMTGCTDIDESRDPDANYVYANRLIKLQNTNLDTVKLPGSLGGRGIDVKMETGTGKTYVYTRMMYELHRQYGLNKFILFVPSLPIKEGAKSFVTADYARQHFAKFYPNVRLDLDVINAGSFSTKKGRKTMSGELMDYLEGSRNEKNTIKCLLLNDAMLMSKSMTRKDYDQTLIGSTSCPAEGLKLTRPVVIIDEPHRFKKDGKAYHAIEQLNPQLIVRFGATFPDIETGRGRNKVVSKDYENLVYNLGSVEAFNGGLVKSVDVHYPKIGDEAASEATKYRVVEIKSTGDKYVRFKRIGDEKTFDIKANESLAVVDEAFEGDVELAEIKNADLAILSNELELHKGTILLPQVFSASYQELLVKQAIDKHFAKERANWFRKDAEANAPRIKTLSLFFIDSIPSYRPKDGESGWLKDTFERLLTDKLTQLLDTEANAEYRDFLKQSLLHIGETHGGYFSEDMGSGDEAIQKEVDDILRNKEKLLAFKDGENWSLRRFLFSKWTLREGWDNPNVFVITKLRTSGSEISKLQEVGRGLRLPIDEFGKRLSDSDFRLDYIIDWSESSFAAKLVGEINSDSGQLEKITDDLLNKLVGAGYADVATKAKAKLLLDDIIDEHDKVLDRDKLIAILPAGAFGELQKGKITSNGSNKPPKIKLRKQNWAKIIDLWEDVTKRYMLEFERLDTKELLGIVESSLNEDNLVAPTVEIRSMEMSATEDTVSLTESIDYQDTAIGQLHYGEFLKRLARRTSVPVQVWHTAMCSVFASGINKTKLNLQSLEEIITSFQSEFALAFAEKYQYSSLNYAATTSVVKDGSIVDELEQGLIGTTRATDVSVLDNYLYDVATYDSEIEHEVLKIRPDEKVVVFGKLPRRSIKVPTYTGGTTTPDFIYGIDKGGGRVELNLLIETKSGDLRMSEKIAVSAQDKLFSSIKNVVWRKVVESSQVNDIIRKL